MKKHSVFFKAVSWVLIGSFFFSQTAYALTPEEQAIFDSLFAGSHGGGSGQSTPQQLIAAQTNAQNAVAQQNTLQDLQGLNFTLTTQNGDILNYVNNTLSTIVRPDGTRLENIDKDNDGNITGANVLLPDGTLQAIRDGGFLASQQPDGSRVIYNAQTGRIQKTVSNAGVETLYSYENDRTTLENTHFKSIYDAEGRLEYILDKESSRQSYLNAGILQKLVLQTGEEYHFRPEVAGSRTQVLDFYQDAAGRRFFGDFSALDAIEYQDGTLTGLNWGEGDVLSGATLQTDDSTKFYYENGQLVRKEGGVDEVTHFQELQNDMVESYRLSGEAANTSLYEQSSLALSENWTNRVQIDPSVDTTLGLMQSQTGGAKLYQVACVGGILKVSAVNFTISYAGFGARRIPKISVNSTVLATRTLESGQLHDVDLSVESQALKIYSSPSGTQRSLVYEMSLLPGPVSLRHCSTSGNFSSRILSAHRIQPVSEISRFVLPEIARPTWGLEFKKLSYDSSGTISEITKADGGRLIFQDGSLHQAVTADGQITEFDFEESAYSNLISTTISQNNASARYDAHGQLSSVEVGDLVLHYTPQQTLDYLEKTDGTELHDLAFDEDGRLCGARVILPDGRERVYENGHLVRTLEADRSQIFFDGGLPESMLSAQNISYTFNVVPQGIQADIDPASLSLAGDATPVQMLYDTNFNLLQAIRKNNEIIHYADNRIQSVETPSEEERAFAYDTDGSYTITQGHTVSHYSPSNTLERVVIQATAQNPDELDIAYLYGKIRQIRKNGVLTFTYSYEFTAEGQEQAVIQDLEEGSIKRYENGRLLSGSDNATSVISTYEYSPQGKISHVTVSRFGRTLHRYSYEEAGSNTRVTDEEGVCRTYDAENKLISLERDGKFYSYTYHAGANSQDIVEEKLLRQTLADGSEAHYDDWGQIERLVLTDGTVLTGVQTEGGLLKKATMTTTDGRAITFDREHVLEETKPDGTRLIYDGGRLSRVESASGNYDLRYDVSGGVVSKIYADLGNQTLVYDALGRLVSLELENIPSPAEVLSQIQDSSSGGSNGAWSSDGDFNTAQTGGNNHSLVSTQTLSSPSTITGFSYRFGASASSHGSTDNGSTAYSYLQTQDATTGAWTIVPGSFFYQSHYNSGGGGSTAYANTANPQILSIQIPNVIAVRAQAGVSAYSNGGGSAGGSSAIYEVLFNLADQSIFSFSQSATALSFQNALGSFSFDSQGASLPGSLAAASQDVQALSGKIQNLTQLSVRPQIFESLPAAHLSWVETCESAALEPSVVVVQEYSSSGVLETQIKADQTVTLFENNRPLEVLDREGRVLMQYLYDANGNPTRVYLRHARDTLPDQIAKAREEIETQRAEQLRELSEQRNLAYQQIYAQAETQRQLLGYQLQQLQDQESFIQSMDAKGKDARAQKAGALGQIQEAFDQITGSLTQISKNEADAYAQLDAQVRSLSDQINQNATQAFTRLAEQEIQLKKQIIYSEISGLVWDAYRTLGRDPDGAEYDYWISQVDYNSGSTLTSPLLTLQGVNFVQALTAHIQTHCRAELDARSAYVQAVKQSVRSEIATYLTLSAADQAAYAAHLGLASEDLIPLSQSDAATVLSWIDGQDLRFGRSALESLESLLQDKLQRPLTAEERAALATEAIVHEVLTGLVSVLNEGKLLISAQCLEKMAERRGLTLETAHLSWDDLSAIFSTPQTPPGNRKVIAHIFGNHYVSVESINTQANTITYRDFSIGSHGSVVTVTKSEFLSAWRGDVVLEESVLLAAPISDPDSRIVSKAKAESIRGAGDFWDFLEEFAGVAGSILSFIPGLQPIGWALLVIDSAISAIKGDILGALGGLVSLGFAGAFSGISQAFNGAFQGIGNAFAGVQGFFNSAGQFITKLFAPVTGFLGSVARGIGQFLDVIPGVSSKAAEMLAKTIVLNTLSSGVNHGLTSLGVSQETASIAGSLVSGLFSGAMKAESTVEVVGNTHVMVSQSQNIQSALRQTLVVRNLVNLGLQLDLAPELTQILSLSAAALAGDAIENSGSSIELAFSNIGSNLIDGLVNYGLREFSNAVGLPTDVGQAIGGVAIGVARAGVNGTMNGAGILQVINQGITQGIVRYGFNFLETSSPYLGSILSPEIRQFVENTLNQQGLFQGARAIAEKLFSSAQNGLAQLGRITQNFGSMVSHSGLVGALQQFVSSIFSPQTVETIANSGRLGGLVSAPQQPVSLPSGELVNELVLTNETSIYFDDQGNLRGTKEGDFIRVGNFGLNENDGIAIDYEEAYINYQDGNRLSMSIEDDKIVEARIHDASGQLLNVVEPRAGQGQLSINANTGLVMDGYIKDLKSGHDYVVINGQIVEIVEHDFFSQDSAHSITGVSGSQIYSALGLSGYGMDIDQDLDIRWSVADGGISVSIDASAQAGGVTTLGHILSTQEIINFIKNQSGGSRLSSDSSDQIIRTGRNSYVGYKDFELSEVYQNGLSFNGVFQAGNDYRNPILLDGSIVHEIDSQARLTAQVQNGLPVSMMYQGQSDLANFQGIRATDNKLMSGTLKLMNKIEINFQGGIITGYRSLLTPSSAFQPLSRDVMIDALRDTHSNTVLMGANGIFNQGVDSEPDFIRYIQAIGDEVGYLYPGQRPELVTNIPLFTNSEPYEPFFQWMTRLDMASFAALAQDLSHQPLIQLVQNMDYQSLVNLMTDIYSYRSRSQTSVFLNQLYDSVRDVAAVQLNQLLSQLTNEARLKMESRYASPLTGLPYSSLNGSTLVMESGSKTALIDLINQDYNRVNTLIMVSANISSKITNPYVKTVVNFTSNFESPVHAGVNPSMTVADIFASPSPFHKVFNIQFDDRTVNKNDPSNVLNHVDYARDLSSPYRPFFLQASALASNAIYDNGAALEGLLMQVKGFQTRAQLTTHLIDNDNVILITEDDLVRLVIKKS